MKRKLAVLVIASMLAASLAACSASQNTNPTTEAQTQEKTSQSTETTVDNTNNETTQEDNKPVDKNYKTRINVSINPDADILTDDDGKVVEIVCNNDDAVTAYSELEVAGKDIEEVAAEMVKAATDAGFMQDEKPVTLTIVDSDVTGEELLNEALAAKDGVQAALVEEDFQNAPIHAEIAEQEEVGDDTCDLCFGSGVLVCEECHGTTYLDGNAWTVCGLCSGAGKTSCTLCEGAGSTTCDSCGGSGADASQEDGKCFACHGAGKMPCTRCTDGSGYQECYDCKGAGKLGGLPCNHCGGTLWGMCNRCEGSGKRSNN